MFWQEFQIILLSADIYNCGFFKSLYNIDQNYFHNLINVEVKIIYF